MISSIKRILSLILALAISGTLLSVGYFGAVADDSVTASGGETILTAMGESDSGGGSQEPDETPGTEVPGEGGTDPTTPGTEVPGEGGTDPTTPGTEVPGEDGTDPTTPGTEVPGEGGTDPTTPGTEVPGEGGTDPTAPETEFPSLEVVVKEPDRPTSLGMSLGLSMPIMRSARAAVASSSILPDKAGFYGKITSGEDAGYYLHAVDNFEQLKTILGQRYGSSGTYNYRPDNDTFEASSYIRTWGGTQKDKIVLLKDIYLTPTTTSTGGSDGGTMVVEYTGAEKSVIIVGKTDANGKKKITDENTSKSTGIFLAVKVASISLRDLIIEMNQPTVQKGNGAVTIFAGTSSGKESLSLHNIDFVSRESSIVAQLGGGLYEYPSIKLSGTISVKGVSREGISMVGKTLDATGATIRFEEVVPPSSFSGTPSFFKATQSGEIATLSGTDVITRSGTSFILNNTGFSQSAAFTRANFIVTAPAGSSQLTAATIQGVDAVSFEGGAINQLDNGGLFLDGGERGQLTLDGTEIDSSGKLAKVQDLTLLGTMDIQHKAAFGSDAPLFDIYPGGSVQVGDGAGSAEINIASTNYVFGLNSTDASLTVQEGNSLKAKTDNGFQTYFGGAPPVSFGSVTISQRATFEYRHDYTKERPAWNSANKYGGGLAFDSLSVEPDAVFVHHSMNAGSVQPSVNHIDYHRAMTAIGNNRFVEVDSPAQFSVGNASHMFYSYDAQKNPTTAVTWRLSNITTVNLWGGNIPSVTMEESKIKGKMADWDFTDNPSNDWVGSKEVSSPRHIWNRTEGAKLDPGGHFMEPFSFSTEGGNNSAVTGAGGSSIGNLDCNIGSGLGSDDDCLITEALSQYLTSAEYVGAIPERIVLGRGGADLTVKQPYVGDREITGTMTPGQHVRLYSGNIYNMEDLNYTGRFAEPGLPTTEGRRLCAVSRSHNGPLVAVTRTVLPGGSFLGNALFFGTLNLTEATYTRGIAYVPRPATATEFLDIIVTDPRGKGGETVTEDVRLSVQYNGFKREGGGSVLGTDVLALYYDETLMPTGATYPIMDVRGTQAQDSFSLHEYLSKRQAAGDGEGLRVGVSRGLPVAGNYTTTLTWEICTGP